MTTRRNIIGWVALGVALVALFSDRPPKCSMGEPVSLVGRAPTLATFEPRSAGERHP